MARHLVLLAIVLLVAACGGGTVPAEWQLAAPPTGTELRLDVALGLPCNDLLDPRVTESSGSVVIQTAARRTTGDCDSMFEVVSTNVELSQPLGDRRLEGCAPSDDDTIRFGDQPLERCGPE